MMEMMILVRRIQSCNHRHHLSTRAVEHFEMWGEGVEIFPREWERFFTGVRGDSCQEGGGKDSSQG